MIDILFNNLNKTFLQIDGLNKDKFRLNFFIFDLVFSKIDIFIKKKL